jgi:hypothetical protein
MISMSTIDYASRSSWDRLIFGTFDSKTVCATVGHPRWQSLRIAMQNTPLESRFIVCNAFANAKGLEEKEQLHRRICVTNYVHALARGGMIK